MKEQRPPVMETKTYPFMELKATENGKFTGYASTYNRDYYGDRMVPGAFAQSIRENRGKLPLYVEHERRLPIGFSVDLAEDAKGLYTDAQLSLESSGGADVYAVLKTAAAIDYKMGLSIGFLLVESEEESNGTRLIKAADLKEISVTTFPANKQSRIDVVKSARDWEQLLRDVGGCSRDGAKRMLSMFPALFTGVDGNSPTAERDARLLRHESPAVIETQLRISMKEYFHA